MPVFLQHNISGQLSQLAGSVEAILPELVLTGVFLLAIILTITIGKRRPMLVPWTVVAGLLAAAATVIANWDGRASMGTAFLGMVRADGFAGYFKLLFAIAGIAAVLVSMRSRKLRDASRGLNEYFLVLLAMLIGMHFMSMAQNLLMMYLALELVSLPSYLLTAYTRLSPKSAEASMKYVIYGAASSGVTLYAISWLYGLTGTLDPAQPDFAAGLAAAGTWPVTFLFVLLLAGFAFKISSLPFHFWAPDVYEGAPYPVAAFFSVAPKAAGFAMLIRLMTLTTPYEAFPEDALRITLGVMALGSMWLGNLVALRQNNFRRMLAWSSVAHTGYMLVGVLCFSAGGYAAVMFYLSVYLFMNFGAFLSAGWLEEYQGVEDLGQMKGLATGLPVLAAVIAVFMVALTGLPPSAGFIGKMQLFIAGFGEFSGSRDPLLLILLISLVLNTVLSLFYYIRVPALMIFQNPSIKNTARFHGWVPVLLVIFALPVLWLGIMHFDALTNFLLGLIPIFDG